MNHRSLRSDSVPASGAADRRALWIVLATGLLLMAAAIARGDSSRASASRTETFQATLPPGSTARIENVSGDVVARPGSQFSAAVSITVTAPTAQKANELLRSTTVTQSREGGQYALETVWPLSDRASRDRRKFPRSREDRGIRCEDCRITARYEVTVPPGVRALLHTVNGQVRAEGLDGDLDLQTVNGPVLALGARRSVTAHAVNGSVDVAASSISPGAAYRLDTVNGRATLVLPRDARFDLVASTMSGSIATTFPLQGREEGPETEEPPRRPAIPPVPPAPPGPAPRAPGAEPEPPGERIEIDLRELEGEIDQAMREAHVEMERAGREMERAGREIERHTRKIRVLDPRRSYKGSIGHGGASVQISTLNGPVLLLAEGTREADAKPLVSRKHFFSVTVPRVNVHVPRPPRVAMVPRAAVEPGEPDEEVVRGDISGDFLSTTGAGGYRVGHVSGRVKIFTRSGEVHIQSVGREAEIRTLGGDIRLGTVGGNLSAHTSAGDIRCRGVAGDLDAETAGGDIRVDRVEGSARAKTAGGDVVLSSVAGGLTVQTSGGEVRAAVVSREPRGGISIANAGGDVTLTLPSDFHGDFELTVAGVPADEEDLRIHSDFPELAVARRGGSQQAAGPVNGGGPRVAVRTSSGEIRVRKGPAAGR
jgi:hypothetical protein